MSERLSRMDRHPSTKKKRRKRQTFKQEWQENQRRLSDTTVLRLSVPENRSVLPESQASTLSSSPAASIPPPVQAEIAMEPRLRGTAATEPVSVQTEEEVEELPPRSVLYPSGQIRWTKWFYETLILLFLILLGTLLWWGTQATGVRWPWQ